jgi:hypothetical protein
MSGEYISKPVALPAPLRETPRTDSLSRSLGHLAGNPAVEACLRHARTLERELRVAESFLATTTPEVTPDA